MALCAYICPIKPHLGYHAILIDTWHSISIENIWYSYATQFEIHDSIQQGQILLLEVLQVFRIEHDLLWQLIPSLQFWSFCIEKTRLVFLEFRSTICISIWHVISRTTAWEPILKENITRQNCSFWWSRCLKSAKQEIKRNVLHVCILYSKTYVIVFLLAFVYDLAKA